VAFIGGQIPPTQSDAQVIQHLESLGLIVDAYDDEPANRPTAAEITAGYDLVIGSSTLLSANVAGEFRNEVIPFIYWESALSLTDRESLADGPDIDGGQTQINVVDNTHPVMAGIPSGLVTLTTSGSNFSRSTGPVAPGAQVLATNAGDPNRRMIVVAESGAELLDGNAAAGKRAFLYLYDTTWLNTNETGKQILDNAVAWALGPVNADFDSSVVSGTAPLTVDFADTSTGPVTSWLWDFGDGTTSSLRNPSHAYTTAGTYDVSLTVTGVEQMDFMTCPDFIQVVSTLPSDFDGDQDVDMSDYGHLQACFTETAAGPIAPGCEDADLDTDNDVDQNDFAVFVDCISGPDIPASPGCAG
jgi:hypothetical protein